MNSANRDIRKIAIVLNGISLKKKLFYTKILPSLQKNFQATVFETRTKLDGIALASKAVDKRFDVILAAGGDGTLNQVLNGMLRDREEFNDLPVLGVLPLGSGNDFARALRITADADALISRLHAMAIKRVDVGKVIYQGGEKPRSSYFINVADAGMGPEVVSRMLASGRAFGSSVAYYAAIVSTFFSYKPITVSIKATGWQWKNKLRTIAIGNGKFYGHGICIAPDAIVDDGIFSTFVCGDVSVMEFIRYSGALKRSKKITHPKVQYSSAQHLELTAEAPCRIEADGELLGYLPATIVIIPGKIKFLC
jgi:diacylglycerol kinase (ATP)